MRYLRDSQWGGASTANIVRSIQTELLATPTNPQYIFNTRDLHRIWQGMMHATADVICDAAAVLTLWTHECSCVIADRY